MPTLPPLQRVVEEKPLQGLGPFLAQRADFRTSLVIPAAPFQMPEQRFTLLVAETRAVLENYPEDSWPKIVIRLEAESLSSPFELKQFLVRPSANTLIGHVLCTRVLFVLSQVGRCFVSLPSMQDLQFSVSPLTQSERQRLMFPAKLYRKLRYLEKFFELEFTLPDEISAEEVRTIDLVFRGITEGEFPVWDKTITFPREVLPQGSDLTAAPFTSPGPLTVPVGDSVILFGRQLPIGPVTVSLEKALLENGDAIHRMKTHPGEPVELVFQVLDQRITHRFEKFARQSRNQLRERLEMFKTELRREEPEELVALLDQSLEGPIRYLVLDAHREFVAEHSELLRRLAE